MKDLFRDSCFSPIQLKTKEIKILDDKMSDKKVYCTCGHSMIFTNGVDRIFCDWCGHYCYKDKKTEFKYKMTSKLSK